ncbi:MAG: hypothetical protein KKI09_08890 [Spirochaetes bacterium]|nr:hypothetical protein [Spirochaetota bacterium]MBU0955528.1 hypothetical protein [Spirochaetota bacterium]
MLGFIMLSVGLTALVIIMLVSFALTASKLKITLPANAPDRWLAEHEQPTARSDRQRPIIVCAGDSITHGAISANWVEILEKRIHQADFINAGVNSELAWNLYQRLNRIIEIDPDVVIILIGTNDANATFGLKSTLNYLAMQKLPELPSPYFYKESLTLILRKLKKESHARVALASIPPIGEDPGHYSWIRAEEYANIGKEVARAEGVEYLPLHEKCCAYIESAPAKQPAPLEAFGRLTQRALWDHQMFGKSWDEISAANGFHLLIDGIHFNSHGAIIMADQVERFIQANIRVVPTQAPKNINI